MNLDARETRWSDQRKGGGGKGLRDRQEEQNKGGEGPSETDGEQSLEDQAHSLKGGEGRVRAERSVARWCSWQTGKGARRTFIGALVQLTDP